jgi:Secretion system C-terminal sorting domain
MQMADISGRMCYAENQTLKRGESTTVIDISKLSLSSGIYFLKVYADTRKMQAVKLFIK